MPFFLDLHLRIARTADRGLPQLAQGTEEEAHAARPHQDRVEEAREHHVRSGPAILRGPCILAQYRR